jgi:hypothetical protein
MSKKEFSISDYFKEGTKRASKILKLFTDGLDKDTKVTKNDKEIVWKLQDMNPKKEDKK